MVIFFDVETTGLEAFEKDARVTMIGLLPQDRDPIIMFDLDEKKLLQQFWSFFDDHCRDEFVGFNCLWFDYKYLFKRSIIVNVKPSAGLKYRMLDLRNLIDQDRMAKGRLSDICCLINGTHKCDNMNGEDAVRLFKEGDYETLKKYLNQDLVLTKVLYDRLKELDLITK